MALLLIRAKLLPVVAGFVFVLTTAFIIALGMPSQSAYATTRDELEEQYQVAVINYENAITEQSENAADLEKTDADIADTDRKSDEVEAQIDDTARTMYRGARGNWVLIDLLLNSESFSDAVARYDQYEKIEGYYREKINDLTRQRDALSQRKAALEARKAEIEQEVVDAKHEVEAAALALLDNDHSDGASFHQRQGVGNNCGATAFIVAVNIILHENRFTDNVAVWESASFGKDSTTDLAGKGGRWLKENDLADLISIETIPGDIHSVQEMRAWLEEGYVVIASSGPGSTWQRADGTQAPANSFPYGHWVVFYRCGNGVFYANDSSVEASKGAGCPYTEKQMQEWLDGRSNHFAVAMKKR